MGGHAGRPGASHCRKKERLMICNDLMIGWTHVRAARAGLSWIAAAALAAAVPLAQGCATDRATQEEPTGDLVISLTQSGPHGEIYQLINATFDIENTRVSTTVNTTIDSSGPQLSVSLPPGLTQVFLRDGWTLQKSTDGGLTFQPVPALLGSLNPNSTRILANQPVFIRFDFLIREVNGTLQISLGVIPEPRELAGGYVVQTATGKLAGYALPQNQNMDFAVFFQLTSLESVTLDDGTKQHVYTAFGQQGSLGPIPQGVGAVAAEFDNDNLGFLSGPTAIDLSGGSLTYTVAARPDGTITLSGSLTGDVTDIELAPSAIDAVLPTIGPDGFPDDVFFYDTEVPFTQTSPAGTIAGILRLRHIVPSP
jgi:hypothetical protein